jgi:hypothetical protein
MQQPSGQRTAVRPTYIVRCSSRGNQLRRRRSSAPRRGPSRPTPPRSSSASTSRGMSSARPPDRLAVCMGWCANRREGRMTRGKSVAAADEPTSSGSRGVRLLSKRSNPGDAAGTCRGRLCRWRWRAARLSARGVARPGVGDRALRGGRYPGPKPRTGRWGMAGQSDQPAKRRDGNGMAAAEAVVAHAGCRDAGASAGGSFSSRRLAPPPRPSRPAFRRGWPLRRRPSAVRSSGRPGRRRSARGAAWPPRRPGS